MTYQNEVFTIEDISAEAVPTGTFEVHVTLTDGHETIISKITVLIYKAPTFDDAVDEGGSVEGVQDVNEDGVTVTESSDGQEGSGE